MNVQGDPPVAVEPYDSVNEKPLKQPYLKAHPEELDELKQARGKSPIRLPFKIVGWLVAIFFGGAVTFSLIEDGVPPNQIPLAIVFLLMCVPLIASLLTSGRAPKKTLRELERKIARLKKRKENVGWTALCPSCKEEHSRYRNDDQDLTSGPAHCKSCGKQFMLLKGKSHAIKR